MIMFLLFSCFWKAKAMAIKIHFLCFLYVGGSGLRRVDAVSSSTDAPGRAERQIANRYDGHGCQHHGRSGLRPNRPHFKAEATAVT
jgi:hypothetical protein